MLSIVVFVPGPLDSFLFSWLFSWLNVLRTIFYSFLLYYLILLIMGTFDWNLYFCYSNRKSHGLNLCFFLSVCWKQFKALPTTISHLICWFFIFLVSIVHKEAQTHTNMQKKRKKKKQQFIMAWVSIENPHFIHCNIYQCYLE